MASKVNKQLTHRAKSFESGLSRLAPCVVGAGVAVLFYGALYRYPLVNGIDSPFFYPLLGAGFVATITAIAGWWGRREILKKPHTWASWLVGSFLFMGVVAVGVGGAFATWSLFVILNGALDFGPATRQAYTVADFHEDCGGARAKDKSYYLLEPRGTRSGYGPIQARVHWWDEEGLPVDGGGSVPVGGKVVVKIKPGVFGEPWQAGYHRD
jgi:hypothetical protein